MSLLIQQNISLKTYNTFGVEVFAKYFVSIKSEEELQQLFLMPEFISIPKLVLGSGSNILFTKDYDGLVVLIDIKGVSHSITNDSVLVIAQAGEVWNDLVKYCVERGFAGIENLSLIPGTAGAAPVQNIGAYGTELKDVFQECRVFDTRNKEFFIFKKEDCHFSYRDSIFKSRERERYIITSIVLKLSTIPRINISYGSIQDELTKRGIHSPTIQDVAKVVSHIRVAKLPDPCMIGNSGSFFKNPVIDVDFFVQIQSDFVDIVHYPMADNKVKIAAGWLIEQCGWKGKKVGNTGTWKNQALVLVNHGNATGSEVYSFSERVIASVYSKFGIRLEREVNVL